MKKYIPALLLAVLVFPAVCLGRGLLPLNEATADEIIDYYNANVSAAGKTDFMYDKDRAETEERDDGNIGSYEMNKYCNPADIMLVLNTGGGKVISAGFYGTSSAEAEMFFSAACMIKAVFANEPDSAVSSDAVKALNDARLSQTGSFYAASTNRNYTVCAVHKQNGQMLILLMASDSSTAG